VSAVAEAAARVRAVEAELADAKAALDQALNAEGWLLAFSHVNVAGQRERATWQRTVDGATVVRAEHELLAEYDESA
jgi:hypothetical protein